MPIDPREVLVTDWIERDRPVYPIRAPRNLATNRTRLTSRAAHRLWQISDGGWNHEDACPTLGDVADLTWAQANSFKNCGKVTLREIAASLARAGVKVSWRKPLEAMTEVVELRNHLTVLAAAWASNANHDPHPGTACAWRSASKALDKLLEGD